MDNEKDPEKQPEAEPKPEDIKPSEPPGSSTAPKPKKEQEKPDWEQRYWNTRKYADSLNRKVQQLTTEVEKLKKPVTNSQIQDDDDDGYKDRELERLRGFELEQTIKDLCGKYGLKPEDIQALKPVDAADAIAKTRDLMLERILSQNTGDKKPSNSNPSLLPSQPGTSPALLTDLDLAKEKLKKARERVSKE